ncbi:sialin-like protein, partial [Leptotrombidium deliense]
MTDTERDILNIQDQKRRTWIIPVRYVFVALGFFGFFMLYSLRVNLSVAIVSMTVDGSSEINQNFSTECYTRNTSAFKNETRGEFHWNQYTQGIILGSFFWGYIITQIPGGALADRFGSKYVLGYSIFFTSILTLLSPLAAEKHYIL